MNLEPFDIEKVKAGRKVVTRDGREAIYLCERKFNNEFKYVFEIPDLDIVTSYTEEGFYVTTGQTEKDLLLAPEEMYVNIFKGFDREMFHTSLDSANNELKELINQNDYLGTYKLVKV